MVCYLASESIISKDEPVASLNLRTEVLLNTRGGRILLRDRVVLVTLVHAASWDAFTITRDKGIMLRKRTLGCK